MRRTDAKEMRSQQGDLVMIHEVMSELRGTLFLSYLQLKHTGLRGQASDMVMVVAWQQLS